MNHAQLEVWAKRFLEQAKQIVTDGQTALPTLFLFREDQGAITECEDVERPDCGILQVFNLPKPVIRELIIGTIVLTNPQAVLFLSDSYMKHMAESDYDKFMAERSKIEDGETLYETFDGDVQECLIMMGMTKQIDDPTAWVLQYKRHTLDGKLAIQWHDIIEMNSETGSYSDLGSLPKLFKNTFRFLKLKKKGGS